MKSIKIELKNLSELIPADYNPRKDLQPGDDEYERLKNSIDKFGYVEPIIWNKLTGRVVGGHQRLKVLKDLGEAQAECVIVELDEDNEKALNIALNKISGEWDIEKLNKIIEDLKAVDFDMDLTGFNQAELDKLLSEALKDTASEDDFDIEQALNEPLISQPGDIWELGRHKIICGDACSPASLAELKAYKNLLGGLKANLLLTDPPYEEAQSLDLNYKKNRLIIIACATLLTSNCVSVIGNVGWVGMVIPHIARAFVGENSSMSIPVSALCG